MDKKLKSKLKISLGFFGIIFLLITGLFVTSYKDTFPFLESTQTITGAYEPYNATYDPTSFSYECKNLDKEFERVERTYEVRNNALELEYDNVKTFCGVEETKYNYIGNKLYFNYDVKDTDNEIVYNSDFFSPLKDITITGFTATFVADSQYNLEMSIAGQDWTEHMEGADRYQCGLAEGSDLKNDDGEWRVTSLGYSHPINLMFGGGNIFIKQEFIEPNLHLVECVFDKPLVMEKGKTYVPSLLVDYNGQYAYPSMQAVR